MPDSALTLLLDFDDQYRRDRQQSSDFLHRRDRRLALQPGLAGGHAVEKWLHAVGARPAAVPRPDPRLRLWRRLRLVFVLAGAVLGVLVMLGLLYYNGGRRINVTLIVAVAVLQLALALATSGQALVGLRPWRSLFRDGLPRWWPLAGEQAGMLRALQGPLAARVAHSGGLAFALAALLTLLTQVLIHDLAFGWATTLQTSAPAYHDFTRALAWPWQAWLPQAVPSLHLVEQSRYFRIGDGTVANAALLGRWWSFLALLWTFYVLVPRLILLALSCLQVRWRAHRLLTNHPGMADWRRRCRTPWVEGADDDTKTEPLPPTAQPALTPACRGRILIRWAGAGDDDWAAQLLGESGHGLEAGGTAGLEQDQQVLEQARQIGGPILLVTRGWEPPIGDLADFLDDARQHLPTTPIQLLPLAPGESPARAGGAALAPWRRFVARRNDPALTLVDLPAGHPDNPPPGSAPEGVVPP